MIAATLIIVFYSAWLIVATYHWFQIPYTKHTENQPSVTIIIPVRNESKHIVETLTCILSNDYKNFDIIVVNDHSSDDTAMKVQEFESKQVHLLNLKKGFGKKAAITLAILESLGELIICTDGDTYVGDQWIQSHVDAYNTDSKLSFGRVIYRGTGLSNFLNQELAALVAVGAVSNHLGQPGMINGCNYSFAKDAFESVNGFEGNEEIPSGDDEFLLRKIHRQYPNSINFLKTKKALVETEPPISFLEFFNQRKRWSSKWKKHKDLFTKIVALGVFGLHVSFLYLFSFGLMYQMRWTIFVLLIRTVCEFVFIRSTNSTKTSVPVFLLLQIIYPIYAVFFGIASTFGKYLWRDRTYHI